ncbi:MAG: carotenoid oxygenase family protein, partial [Steroidobacteraceae bacterium]
REELFLAPYVSMIHDWAVTDRHLVFPLMPTTADADRMRKGGPHWMFDPDLDTEIGLMRRDAEVADLRWYRAPPCGVGHVVNAFSDGERVCVDIFVSERNQFPFIANADGSAFEREKSAPRLTRWSFDLARRDGCFESRTLYADFMEMPAIDPRYQMHPYRHAFCTVVDPTLPLNVAGTIGVGWNVLAHLDVATGRMERYPVGDAAICQEPCFVPRSPGAPEGEGFVLAQLTRCDGYLRTEIIVLDAQHLADGPIATLELPLRLRPAVHGTWVPASQERARGSA